MTGRMKAITKKEFKQLLRDGRMLGVLFFFPVFLLVIFGYAVNFDVQNIKLGVLDQDRSGESRDFTESLTAGGYFEISVWIEDEQGITEALEDKDAQVVLVIPPGFSRDIARKKEPAEIQFLIDGVDGNTATIIYNYLNGAAMNYNSVLRNKSFRAAGIQPYFPVVPEPVFWFNPSLKTTWYMIPGLIAMILIVTAVVSVSLSLVREKERGTIEQINVSSLNNFELLAGKSLPYVIIALINAAFVILAGYLLFGLAVKGSLLMLFGSTLVFITACIAIGIFISVAADSQQVAFTASTFVSLLPSVVLSGFIFPIESMPWLVQIFTNLTPAKFYIISLRSIMLRGAGLGAYWPQLIYMLIFTAIFLTAAMALRKRKAAKL